jgi:hypothetical protein
MVRGETFAQLHKTSLCHTGESRYPVLSSTFRIPVFTGMTNKGVVQRSRGKADWHSHTERVFVLAGSIGTYNQE